jgi:hypothetical protein
MPLSSDGSEGNNGATAGTSPEALTHGWAKLEATQTAWKEKQEIRELELSSKEHTLKDLQEELEHQQQLLSERRRTIALEAATQVAQMEQRMVASQGDTVGRRPTAEFTMADDATPTVVDDGAMDSDGSNVVDDDCDDMYDMDWTALATGSSSSHVASTHEPIIKSLLPESLPSDNPCGLAIATDVPAEVLAAEFPVHAVAAPEEALANGARPAAVAASQRAASQLVGRSVQGWESPPVEDVDGEALRRKLDEKRILAELHNGKDLTQERNAAVDKGEMPGVHPSIAEKLLLRRQLVDQAEKEEDAARCLQDPESAS